MDRRRARVAALLMLGTSIAAAGSEPGPNETALRAERVPWTRLRFEARKLFLKGTSEIRLSSLASSSLDEQLIATPESVAMTSLGPRTALLDLRSSFAGRDSVSRVWFDPRHAFALQRRKRRHGGKAYEKTYRFSRDGVFSHRRAPRTASEGRRPVAEWSGVQETFYRHPEARDCSRIVDPALLFYLASAVELEAGGAPAVFCAFSDKSLHRVELRARGRGTLAVDYLVTSSPGGEPAARPTRRKGSIEVLKIAATASPVDAGSESSFELLGLQGDVELYLAERVPVQVSGRLPGLGRVNVKLVEVDLN